MSETVQPIDTEAPVILKITTSGIKAEFQGTNGRKVFKNIGLQSMSRILNKDSEFDTGFLPLYGRNYMGIKKYIKLGDKEIVFIEGSPCNRTVKYYNRNIDNPNQDLLNVRFPGLIMAVVCNVEKSGALKVVNTRLFATQGPVLRDSDQLYRFPFGNVYQPDGRICWGSASHEQQKIKNLTQAGSLLDTFLFSRMNSDLYGGSCNKSGKNLDSYLESLKDISDFPYGDLIPEISFKELTSLLKSKNVR